ncbi:MAG: hypothetical protein WAK93_19320 [Solirubrobacteraceae bacterium]
MATAITCVVAIVTAAGAGSAGADESIDDPIGVHSMLQLNDPPSFMAAMFAEAAKMDASAIRLDVAPALAFPGPSQPPDFSGLDEVMALPGATTFPWSPTWSPFRRGSPRARRQPPPWIRLAVARMTWLCTGR